MVDGREKDTAKTFPADSRPRGPLTHAAGTPVPGDRSRDISPLTVSPGTLVPGVPGLVECRESGTSVGTSVPGVPGLVESRDACPLCQDTSK